MSVSMDTTIPQLVPGQIVGGRFRIVALLGEGGMAEVYEGTHVGLGTSVALKVLDAHYANQAAFLERFNREARAAATITSPHIARVLDVGALEDGRPFLVMERLIGHDLGSLVASRGPLSITAAADYVLQAARGLEAAHAMGIVHRDVKPENLFACQLGPLAEDRRLIKVVDFGIAKDVRSEASRMTAPGETMGSVMYMSPEQIRSASAVDERTDVWALGIVLFELLTGAPPFDGDQREVLAKILTEPIPRLREIRPDVPKELEDVMMRALTKDIAARFQTMFELARALSPFAPVEPAASLLARLPPDSIPTTREELPAASQRHRLQATTQGWSSGASTRSTSSSPTFLLFVIASGVLFAIGIVFGSVALWHASGGNQSTTTTTTPPSVPLPVSAAPTSIQAPSVEPSAAVPIAPAKSLGGAAPPTAPTSRPTGLPPQRTTPAAPRGTGSGALPRRF